MLSMLWEHYPMAIDLLYLANNITNQEFAKLVVSSGDYFPGFYRFTMGDRNHERKQLSLKGLLACYFDQEVNSKKYTREQWTTYTKERHQFLDARNSSRSDSSVYEMLDQGYLKWMTGAREYDIALIEIDSGVNRIALDETYFFMGSLIRFQKDSLSLGFDLLRNESVLTIKTDTSELIEYTERMYQSHLKDFFLPADCVASLEMVDGTGTLSMSDKTVARAMTSDSNTVVIASNRDVSKQVPIRWAKDIILTEVNEL
jgi:hypothetical protein